MSDSSTNSDTANAGSDASTDTSAAESTVRQLQRRVRPVRQRRSAPDIAQLSLLRRCMPRWRRVCWHNRCGPKWRLSDACSHTGTGDTATDAAAESRNARLLDGAADAVAIDHADCWRDVGVVDAHHSA